MIGNKYKYGLIDASYILSRSVFATIKEYNLNVTASDVVRNVIYTLRKLGRDYGVTCDKLIFIWDKWDIKYNGYYRTYLLTGKYKDDREYITESDIDKALTEEEKRLLELKAYQNKVKYEAKQILQNELGKFGVPSFMRSAYECDDICYISASILYSDNKPSILISRDSDYKYFINPRVDCFRIPVRNLSPQIVTYNEVIEEVPIDLRTRISLYQWKSFYDSIEGSHNAMRRTRKDRTKTEEIIRKIVNSEDYSDIEDYDTFRRQYDSFQVEKFPDFNKVCQMTYYYDKSGKCGSLDEFREFNEKYKLNISDKYFKGFIESLDTKLYSEI